MREQFPKDPFFEILALRSLSAVRDPGPTAFLRALRGPPRSPRSSALSAVLRALRGPPRSPRSTAG